MPGARGSIALTALLVACAARVPLVDLSAVDPDDFARATRLAVFTVDGPRPPTIGHVIGPITAYSCKHLVTDPPASRGDALQRLRIEAARRGADGITDVTFDTRGADAWGTNCWETVQASGTAVQFSK